MNLRLTVAVMSGSRAGGLSFPLTPVLLDHFREKNIIIIALLSLLLLLLLLFYHFFFVIDAFCFRKGILKWWASLVVCAWGLLSRDPSKVDLLIGP